MSNLVFFLSRPLLVAPGGVLDTVYISTFLHSVHTFVTLLSNSRNATGRARACRPDFPIAYGPTKIRKRGACPHMAAEVPETACCILYTVFCIQMRDPGFPMYFHRKCEQIAHKNKKNGGFPMKTTEKLTFYIKNDIIYGGNTPGYSILYPKYSILHFFCCFFMFFVYCIQCKHLRVIKIFDIITIG